MGTLILSIRIIIGLVVVSSIIVSFMLWREGYTNAGIILLIGLGMFLLLGGVLRVIQKLFPQTAKHFVAEDGK